MTTETEETDGQRCLRSESDANVFKSVRTYARQAPHHDRALCNCDHSTVLESKVRRGVFPHCEGLAAELHICLVISIFFFGEHDRNK